MFRRCFHCTRRATNGDRKMKRTILQRENIRKIASRLTRMFKKKKKREKVSYSALERCVDIYNNKYLLLEKYCSNCSKTIVVEIRSVQINAFLDKNNEI